MTDSPTPKPPPRRKHRRKKGSLQKGRVRRPGAGRPPVLGSVRAVKVGNGYIRLLFSEDVLDMLLEMHDAVYGIYIKRNVDPPRGTKYKGKRVQIARLHDMSIPSIFLRIEPPSFDPQGYKIQEDQGRSRKWFVQVKGEAVGVRADIRPTELEILTDVKSPSTLDAGMLLTFPDECMLAEGDKRRIHPEGSLVVTRSTEMARTTAMKREKREQERRKLEAHAKRVLKQVTKL